MPDVAVFRILRRTVLLPIIMPYIYALLFPVDANCTIAGIYPSIVSMAMLIVLLTPPAPIFIAFEAVYVFVLYIPVFNEHMFFAILLYYVFYERNLL